MWYKVPQRRRWRNTTASQSFLHTQQKRGIISWPAVKSSLFIFVCIVPVIIIMFCTGNSMSCYLTWQEAMWAMLSYLAGGYVSYVILPGRRLCELCYLTWQEAMWAMLSYLAGGYVRYCQNVAMYICFKIQHCFS
jgi:hypothetical protein